jgi:serine/threonine protein kinase
MLSDKQILLKGRSAHAHEQEALEFIRKELPSTSPLVAWELVELVDPASGRLHEIDALILGHQALYLVEIKSGPGVYTGDTVDWHRQAPGEPARYMEPPYKLTNLKAKILRSLLNGKMDRSLVPWIQPLVFLSHENVELKLRNYGDQCVVTRRNFVRAITYNEFPGSESAHVRGKITAPQTRALTQALKEIGVRPSAGTLRVGAYELDAVLEQGPGYEDREAKHSENSKIRRRARSYLVPEQTSTERRQQLRRAANREAQLLEDVKGHPNILRISDYIADAPLGPTVLFDHFNGVRLDAFLRQEPQCSFEDRVEIIAQVGRALEHCHRKEVHHGSLSPSAVLVARTSDGAIDTRLYNFQLGSGAHATQTQHWSALASEECAAYQAPELRESPTAARGPADVFSLGALSYFILTGKAPAESAQAADERMRRERHFDPRAVADGLDADVAQCIEQATEWLPSNRPDSAGEFVEYLCEFATAPAKPAADTNPLEAKVNDELGELKVLRVLGQGASSRVLAVERMADGRQYALKVALNETEDARLLEEAQLLRELRHQRIVQLFETPTFGGRQCLLLALAGSDTLQQRLKQEGLVSLDYAARFGEDLLLALEQLEEQNILHRDIKPANIGVGSVGKQAQHLMVFDFSLGLNLREKDVQRHGPSQLNIGTVAYRDPYLVDRGAWDHAADRWSAAVTLHEMLTGTRPSWAPEGASPRDPEATLALAAERFDASVRDHLTQFFTKALASVASERHPSALTMREHWNRAVAALSEAANANGTSLASPVSSAKLESASSANEEPLLGNGSSSSATLPTVAVDSSTDGDLFQETGEPVDFAAIDPTSPVGALPLSGRALNALDRAGITQAGELARLPNNRLSAVRGVGKGVVQEVIRVRDQWLAARPSIVPGSSSEPGAPASTVVFSGYRGADLALASTSLEPLFARTLIDAGLGTFAVLATAPREQVERLAERAFGKAQARGKLKALKELFSLEQQAEDQRAHPTTLDGWLQALLPPKPKPNQYLRALFGLHGPLAGTTDAAIAAVAKALDLSAPNIYIALNKAKQVWADHAGTDELRQNVSALVARAGGALELESGAHRLAEVYPPSPELDVLLAEVPEPRRRTVAAAALLRIVGVLEKDRQDGLRWERQEPNKIWLLRGVSLQALHDLGSTADELAQREPLAASGETLRTLRSLVESTELGRLSDERLIELAAEASTHAARSSRLELYPRGLSAARALQLSSAALSGELTPEQVQQRVKARYPEAEELPARPALDALLETYGLIWNAHTAVYQRPEQGQHGSHYTQAVSSLATPLTN